MASSTLLRRISSSQIFRSRMLSTAAAGAASPWLMLSARFDKEDEIIFRFQCCANTKIYGFLNNDTSPQINSTAVVGSSHGWLALHDYKDKRNLFLSDPTSKRLIKLPPLLHELHTLILTEREGKAFVILGAGRSLAFCSPQQSDEWTLFAGGEDAYETIVYSSTHRRLFCLTSAFRLEAWDVGGELPRLDWARRVEIPERLHKPGLMSLIYLVCWEESRELFVVVRRVDPSRGRFKEAGAISEFEQPTVDFEVYKIDREGRRVVEMEDSLQGLTMFVGMNHPFAIKGVAGVRPNAIYFAYDKRGGQSDYTFRYYDYGIFDYQKRCVSLCGTNYLAGFDIPQPLWFIPNTQTL